jgi:hypothetical protein
MQLGKLFTIQQVTAHNAANGAVFEAIDPTRGLEASLSSSFLPRKHGVESATLECYTVLSRRLRKYLILKDFYAVRKRWRRGRDSQLLSGTLEKRH